jgi:ribosomal protein S18 acetylase RimI-like enzyme
VNYRTMQMSDYAAMVALWRDTPGIGLSSADTPEAIQAFLERNPGCCFVAEEGGRLIGTALAGSDGRRGYLYHVAVLPERRSAGVGRKLVELCLEALKAQGINKVHLFVMADNLGGIEFWQATGWQPRGDLVVMSKGI